MIKIVRANKLSNKNKLLINKIFIDSFYDYFKSFCDDKSKLYKIFKNVLNIDKYYAVLLDDTAVAIGGIGKGESTLILKKSKFVLNLGFDKGNRAFKYFNLIFQERDYAFEMDDMCAMIEFIAVDEEYRNKNIGYTLINHIMFDNEYERYMVKVANNNSNAISLVEKAGFEEFDVEKSKVKETEDVGVDHYCFMIRENPKFMEK